MKKICRIVFFMICFLPLVVSGQEIDLENLGSRTIKTLKENPFKISGGISANSVFFNSNTNSNRKKFTYFLNGNINLGLYQWNIPLSFSLTNQGSNIGYQIPWKFNRLSLHPRYKWVQAHIGDFNMSFSPYTYNGLNLTGIGIELNPQNPLKIAVISGRLNKAIEDDNEPQTIPAFERMGYGVNIKWEKEKYKIGAIGFYAQDDKNSLKKIPKGKKISPQENLVVSINASSFIHENVEIYGVYSTSFLTNDLRANGYDHNNKLLFFKRNSSTESFHAYNTGVNFTIENLFLGVKYERIDPEYKTLGAYYFNNDLENITLNSNFNLLKNKLNIVTNLGKQIDNLDHQKLKQTSRWVGAINANAKLSEKLIISANYSNFTMFTNKQLNQFSNINKNPLQLQQPKDSIEFKQITQNMSVNVNYIISNNKNCTQNLNINYSLNDAVNKENNIIRKGGISRFHNAFATYSLGFPKKKLNMALSANFTHTYVSSLTSNIWGTSMSVNKSLLKDKLQSSFGFSYNKTVAADRKTNTTNLRLQSKYTPWKKHNFTVSLVQTFRKINIEKSRNNNEITAIIGYSYSF